MDEIIKREAAKLQGYMSDTIPEEFSDYAKRLSGYRGEIDENTTAEALYYATLTSLCKSVLMRAALGMEHYPKIAVQEELKPKSAAINLTPGTVYCEKCLALDGAHIYRNCDGKVVIA